MVKTLTQSFLPAESKAMRHGVPIRGEHLEP